MLGTGTIQFGVFEMDPATGELRKSGIPVSLPPQPFKILALLAGRAGDLVTREEFQREIWGGETFVDFEHGLNVCIRQIRAALGDDADDPRYIQTLPRRGYRFIAAIDQPAYLPAAAGDEAAPQATADKGERKFPVRLLAAGLCGLVAIAAVLFVFRGAIWGRLSGRAASSATPISSVAVLPLHNLSGDPSQDYFVDGMTDALITELAQIRSLRVISRTSAMAYKGTKKTLPQIAAELKVDALVEGSVLRSGDRLRINAQVTHVRADRHLGALSREGDARDALALQREVARHVALEIRASLTSEDRTRLASARPLQTEAYDLYLLGRYFWNMRTIEGLAKAADYFQRAINKDPSYAPALAGLADTFSSLADYRLLPAGEAFPKAKAAAAKALELDDTAGEAHASLAHVLYRYDWDWSAAEKEFRRSLELNPNYATAHHWYAIFLALLGRTDEARTQITRALELDPLALVINSSAALILNYAGLTEQAIERCQRTVEMNPRFLPAYHALAQAYQQKGRHAEAIQALRQVVQLSDASATSLALLGHGCAVGSRRNEAQHILRKLDQTVQRNGEWPAEIALLHAALGNNNLALNSLERALKERSGILSFLKVDRRFDDLRAEPRFQEVLRRIGLN